MWLSLLLITVGLTIATGQVLTVQASNDTAWTFGFEVDYENNQFLLDGKPFRYVSGSFHYFRTPKVYWRDRLRKMRAAGLNAVSTYVEWSLHQPKENQWNWSGDADLVEFINIAKEEDLLVLLRPGPYICAERDLGGLPFWLLSRVPDIKLRTNDPRYMRYVEIYLNEVLEKVKLHLRGNGGPIIMVQVENEYGSYNACDTDYMNQLRRIIQSKVGNKALLYTTDGTSANMLRCGQVPGAFTTIDFGTSVNVNKTFEVLRMFQPRGPLVNSEFYPGWLTHWQEPFQRVNSSAVTRVLDEMLSLGASVNIYMFYGGTNFGYTSGANGGAGSYSPQLTSYDYDAPLTEAGDPTPKYFEIRNVIAKYLPLPNIPLPTVSPKLKRDSVYFHPVATLFGDFGLEKFATNFVSGPNPLTFEALMLPHWLVLYEAVLPRSFSDPAILYANVKDRAQVYVDNILAGTLSRTSKIFSLPLPDPYGRKLRMLVENQGRLNFGNEIHDFKGISNVTVSGIPVGPWNMTAFLIDDVTPLHDIFVPLKIENGTLRNGPVFLKADLIIEGPPLDTYLDTTGWGKGVAFVNGNNLGRYWPLVGPQMTLYIPASFLKTGENELVILELEYFRSDGKMVLENKPILDGRIRYSRDSE